MIKIILKATIVQWFWMNKILQRRRAVLEGDVEMQGDDTEVLLCADSLLRAIYLIFNTSLPSNLLIPILPWLSLPILAPFFVLRACVCQQASAKSCSSFE